MSVTYFWVASRIGITALFLYSDSTLMVDQLESSRTWSLLAFLTRRTSQWGCTLAYGTLMIGPQEEGLWRRTGLKHLSLLPSRASMPMLVFGLMVCLLVAHPTLPVMHGSPKSSILGAKRGWHGCRRITWSTIIVRTQSDSLRASRSNALLPPRHRMRKSRGKFFTCSSYCFYCTEFVFFVPFWLLRRQ